MFVARRGSRAVSPKKIVPELMAQIGPFLLAMHKAHEALGFWLSDLAQDLALLAQEKQVSWTDAEVQDFVETMATRSLKLTRAVAQGMVKSPSVCCGRRGTLPRAGLRSGNKRGVAGVLRRLRRRVQAGVPDAGGRHVVGKGFRRAL